ncbi:AAR2 protein-domain-containing protein [Hypoxylon sp. FL1284]|nr:AAR2 protein-domain-containing protein [Hypoxylon sp. FL1284]
MSAVSAPTPPEVAPQSDDRAPNFCGVTVEIYPPASDSADFSNNNININTSSPNHISVANPPRPSALRSFNSVEAVPTIGTLPLGSLRITEDSYTDTPLTTPDRSRPSTGSGIMTPTGSDVFLLDDLPAACTIGCDAASFSTTKQPFLGFRDIPAGAHLIWVAPSATASTRSAYWIVTPERAPDDPADVHVKQWDQFNEVLSDPASQAEERFQKEKLQQIFGLLPSFQRFQPPAAPTPAPSGRATGHDGDGLPSFLGEGASLWSYLTASISPELLDRIMDVGAGPGAGKKPLHKSWQVTTSDRVVGEPTLAMEARLYGADTQRLRFSFAMDELLISHSATGEQRTRQALDPTDYVIEKLEGGGGDSSSPPSSGSDLAGELSFAFLTGTHLGNHSLLEQWWFLLTRVAFRSFALVVRRPRMALSLIRTLHAQLAYEERHLDNSGGEEGPLATSSVLDAFPEHARALQRALVTYKARLDEQLLGLGDRISPAQHAVGDAFAALEARLWRLGWDLRGDYLRSGSLLLDDGEVVPDAELSDFEDEDERGEYAPAVVRLDDEGRERGRVSWDT